MSKLSLSIVGDNDSGEILIMSVDGVTGEIDRVSIPEPLSVEVATEVAMMLHSIYTKLERYHQGKADTN